MKKNLQNATLLLSVILLAKSVVFAGEISPTDNVSTDSVPMTSVSTDSVSTDSVSGGDCHTNTSTDTPEPISGSNFPADAPEPIPNSAPPADATGNTASPNPPAYVPNDASDADSPTDLTTEINSEEGVTAPVFSVIVPDTLDFVMDPYELAGQGSIWSQEYAFINKGNIPVKISLSKLHCTAAEDVIIAENENLITAGRKTAALWLYLKGGSIIRVAENNSTCEFALAPGEALTFWVKGKMNVSDQWKDGDLGLSFTYRLKAVENEE